jgi:hypothetical protein
VAWTKLERTIRAGIREDAAKSCVPRRHDLPSGTIAAVECRPSADGVARVGFYLFGSPDEAIDHYLARLRDEGLTYNLEEGRRRYELCWDDYGEGEQKQLDCRYRHAGFVNSSGFANYRAISDAMYIGVLGDNANVTKLKDWARQATSQSEALAPGEMGIVPMTPTLYDGDLVSRTPC